MTHHSGELEPDPWNLEYGHILSEYNFVKYFFFEDNTFFLSLVFVDEVFPKDKSKDFFIRGFY